MNHQRKRQVAVNDKKKDEKYKGKRSPFKSKNVRATVKTISSALEMLTDLVDSETHTGDEDSFEDARSASSEKSDE